MMRYGQSLLWTLILVIAMLALSAVVGRFIYHGPVYSSENYALNSDETTLIIGASHSATGLNPKYIDSSISVARSGEPLYLTYYKTKQLLENNPQIRRAILTLSSIHMCGYSESSHFTGNSVSRLLAMNYYPLIDDEFDPLLPVFSSDRLLAFLKYQVGVPFNYMDDTRVVMKHYVGSLIPQDFRFFGGFEPFEETHLEEAEVIEKAQFYFFGEAASPSLSKVGLESIERLMSLGKTYDIEMVVVGTPEHPTFRKATPSFCSDKYRDLMGSLTTAHSNVTFLDYGSMNLPEDHFLDGDHLNITGSEVFSKMLQDVLATSVQH